MNKSRLIIAVALVSSLSWFGCNKEGKLNEPSTFKTPAGPVELKLKWTAGERIVQDMNMKQTMEMNLPGRPAPMKQEMTMAQEYGLNVLKETPDGGHEVEMEFLRTRMSMAMGGKQMADFDSAKKSPENQAGPGGDIFSKIVGSKIRYFLNATNGIDRLEGVDELMNKLAASGQTPEAGALKGMYNEGFFKQMMSQSRYLPPKPVTLGDTWPVEVEYPMGSIGTLVLDFTYTMKGWEMHGQRNCARLDFDGTVKNKPGTDTAGPMSISSLDGTLSGTSWFDPELGMTIDTALNQDLTMTMNLPKAAGAAAPGGMKMQMNQLMTIKMASVK